MDRLLFLPCWSIVLFHYSLMKQLVDCWTHVPFYFLEFLWGDCIILLFSWIGRLWEALVIFEQHFWGMLYIICIVMMMIMMGGVDIVNCCCCYCCSPLQYSRAAIAIAGSDEGFIWRYCNPFTLWHQDDTMTAGVDGAGSGNKLREQSR